MRKNKKLLFLHTEDEDADNYKNAAGSESEEFAVI